MNFPQKLKNQDLVAHPNSPLIATKTISKGWYRVNFTLTDHTIKPWDWPKSSGRK